MLLSSLPDLTIRNVNYGKQETPWSLLPLLYIGGSAENTRRVEEKILDGSLGGIIEERIPIVLKLHELIQGLVTAGGSRYSAKGRVQYLREFFGWADSLRLSISEETLKERYIDWTDHLIYRQRIIGDIKALTVYSKSSAVASLFDQILNLKTGLLCLTRVRQKRLYKSKAPDYGKVNLTDVFAFGNTLLDIVNGLTEDDIQSPLPIRIKLRTGKELVEWSALVPPEKVRHLIDANVNQNSKRKVIANRAAWSADTSRRTRYPVINLRIEAELLIFIAQTGMNLAQAHKLRAGNFSYQSSINGYQVRRVYKGRRQGEVEFSIYSEYRDIFEKYLKWRKHFFAEEDNNLLFPLYSCHGRSLDVATHFSAIQNRCSILGVNYFGPRILREIKTNWLIRQSKNTELSAELSQHTQETLLRSYEKPDHQAAAIEISRFHAIADPATSMPGPGTCINDTPSPIKDMPSEATPPDCISPAGCLFCTHQRDIDSADHAWSLVSYRYLKSLELSRYKPIHDHEQPLPATAALEQLTIKLTSMKKSSEVRAAWILEACNRIDEGSYHPKWDAFIQLLEASP